MSTTAPKDKAAEKKAAQEAAAAEAKATDALADSHKQVARAMDLEYQRSKLGELIASNRTYLRLMGDGEELTDEQLDWLDDFYPLKEKDVQRSDDEIERTRKAKDAARKRGARQAKAAKDAATS